MNALELKIPPVVLVLIGALFTDCAPKWFPTFNVTFPFQGNLACATILAGFAIKITAMLQFKRAKTTVDPIKPESASALVTSGLFRFSRNPIYLGFFLVLLACVVWTGNPLALAVLPAFVAYMNRFQIQPEERALTNLFGPQFKTYCSNVRRWI